MPIEQRHIDNVLIARTLYLDNLRPQEAAEDWHFATRSARKQVAQALRDSSFLSDIGKALQKDGIHTLVFRQMLAPPLSQDQFKLVCPDWSKSSEKNGGQVSEDTARKIKDTILARLDKGLVRWICSRNPPSRNDVITLLRVTSSQIAVQQVATARRKRLAFEQEYAVVELLERNGWRRLPSSLIDERGRVAPRTFMHKTRFATRTTAPQEVDIACGLPRDFVLAMECKVTNDETNSVKRINDVLKKATSWKEHWGSFFATAALLQGVIAARDVQRLTDGGVEVFWSHDLEALQNWLAARF